MVRSTVLAALAAIAAYSSFSRTSNAGTGKSPATQPVVVVELFTSEGCSSCPPADDVLAALAKPNAVDGVQIIPLGLHVDYWNQLGWKDRFSASVYSDRQRNYARMFNSDQIYTPQMIVDGAEQFVGSDKPKAIAAITKAAANAKGTIAIDTAMDPKDPTTIATKISVNGIQRGSSAVDIMLAITEDDLSTDVPRGENGGRSLHHTAVVRTLQRVATIHSNDSLPFSASTKIILQPDWRTDHLHIAVFAQDSENGKIVAGGYQKRLLD